MFFVHYHGRMFLSLHNPLFKLSDRNVTKYLFWREAGKKRIRLFINEISRIGYIINDVNGVCFKKSSNFESL